MHARPLVVRARRRRRIRARSAFALLVAVTGALILVVVTLGAMRAPAGLDVVRLRLAPVAAAPVRDPAPLVGQINGAIASSGGLAGVVVVDLSGHQPARVAGINADAQFPAASTYKLAALMGEADRIAAGAAHPTDQICYSDSEQEDGWFSDYSDGECFTRQEIAQRAGIYSDNTAGHMLVSDLGGSGALNAYAQQHGARESQFFDGNQTSAADLAALMTSEATGAAGGSAAQGWLYPLLTNTRFEDGIPAGVPSGVTVVHKIGEVDQTVNDVALVSGGGHRYVLAVMTIGLGDQGWDLIAQVSKLVWQYEAA